MNSKACSKKLASYRIAIIDDTAPGQPLRLGIGGKELKTRPGRCWATTVTQAHDQVKFQNTAGRLLDLIAERVDGIKFRLSNQTGKTIALAGFPSLDPNETVYVELGPDGWMKSP